MPLRRKQYIEKETGRVVNCIQAEHDGTLLSTFQRFYISDWIFDPNSSLPSILTDTQFHEHYEQAEQPEPVKPLTWDEWSRSI